MTRIDFRNRSIKRCGFSAAGGSGHQEHTVGLGAEPAQTRHRHGLEAKVIERKPLDVIGERLPIENTQHRVFPKNTGHDGYAKIDFPSLDGNLEAAVLGHAPFCNIQIRHHLDAGNDLFRQIPSLHHSDTGQDTVDAVFDGKRAGHHFQMYVACL